METAGLFSLLEADDSDGLIAALGGSDASAVRNANGESLYLFAVFRGRQACAAALMRRGGLSLHEAALAGDAARVEALLKEAPWAIDLLSPDGWTALHLAAFFGQDAVVVALLARGASARVMGRAFEHNLPIHAACAGGRIGKAAFGMLIAATGDPDAVQKQDYTALMIAAANGGTDAAEILLAAGADRARRQGDGKTAADFARERGHAELAARLA